MNKNRLVYVVVVIILMVMVLLTVRTAVATNTVVMPGSNLTDNTPSQLSNSLPIALSGASNYASDWFERHPDAMNPGNAVDLSDYYLRHPSSTTANTAGASDWSDRYDAMNPGNAVDLSDYYLRHPSSTTANTAGTSDWSERYDAMNPGNAVALPATVTVTDKSAAPVPIDLCMIHAITRCSLLPATVTVTDKSAAPVQIDLWQEHLDLLQMQRSLQSAKDVPSVTAPATITAAERYQALMARQIEKLENLP